MKPYYEHDGVTIFHGDCRDVMPTLGQKGFDIVITSPPYNLGVSSGGFGHYDQLAKMSARGGGGKWHGGDLANGYADHDDSMLPADYETWQRAVLTDLWEQVTDRGAIFYNHKPRVQAGTLWTPLALNPGLPVRQIVIWARAGGVNFAPTHYVPTHEWIVVFAHDGFRLASKGASGVGDVWRIAQESGTEHPAPFPLALPATIIETVRPTSVLDPFMGCGTTLRAAKNAGIRAVGIELSERYCEMAARRLSQEVLDFGAPMTPDAVDPVGGVATDLPRANEDLDV